MTLRVTMCNPVLPARGPFWRLPALPQTIPRWDISPTYTLAVSDQLMTEGEVADAILRASSDEIGTGTAVYIDGELRFVTTEGDHLRAYLEAVKAPYEDAFDSDVRVSFVHDIELMDGVFFLSSIVPYDTVIQTLSAATPGTYYTTESDETAGMLASDLGLSFYDLQQMNPDLTDSEQLVSAGTTLTTSPSVMELLQVQVVRRQSVLEDVQYDTVKTPSDEYDLGEGGRRAGRPAGPAGSAAGCHLWSTVSRWIFPLCRSLRCRSRFPSRFWWAPMWTAI